MSLQTSHWSEIRQPESTTTEPARCLQSNWLTMSAMSTSPLSCNITILGCCAAQYIRGWTVTCCSLTGMTTSTLLRLTKCHSSSWNSSGAPQDRLVFCQSTLPYPFCRLHLCEACSGCNLEVRTKALTGSSNKQDALVISYNSQNHKLPNLCSFKTSGIWRFRQSSGPAHSDR